MREREHARSAAKVKERRRRTTYTEKRCADNIVAPGQRSLHAREITKYQPDEHGEHVGAMQDGEEHLPDMCPGTDCRRAYVPGAGTRGAIDRLQEDSGHTRRQSYHWSGVDRIGWYAAYLY